MKKQRLFREEVKDKHTSHWDLDMMTREELEAAMAQKTDKSSTEKPDTQSDEPSER